LPLAIAARSASLSSKQIFRSKQIGFRLNMSEVTIWVELEDGALILKYEGTFR
jgi:hypothetical protein